MTTEIKIKEVVKQLYPSGRAWNHITDAETMEVIEVYTDGVGAAYTDGVGEVYGNETGSLNPFGKQLFMAESKTYATFFDNAISVLNSLIADNDNFDETDADNWERVLSLFISELTLEQRKAAIIRKQAYPNGILERAYYEFLQQQLQDAGFSVYVHENRFADGSGGWDVQDPDDLTSTPYELGSTEFGVADFAGGTAGISYSITANYLDEDKDNLFYSGILNQAQFGQAQMGISEFQRAENLDRETGLRYSFFICGSSFPDMATVPCERKDEFRQLVLTLKHNHIIGFLLINYN